MQKLDWLVAGNGKCIPVVLNQYTGDNITHKQNIFIYTYIYASRPHELFFFIFGVSLGTVCLIQGYQSVTKTSSHWRHKYKLEKQRIISFSYTMYVSQCENFNIFVYLGGLGGEASIIRIILWTNLGSHLPSHLY